jgi:hypothetical protein
VAEWRAAAPCSPRRLPRRRCTYALLWDVASLSVTTFVLLDKMELSRPAEAKPRSNRFCADASFTHLA